MSAIEIEVKERWSFICPHCFYSHAHNEGSSEMWSDRCLIWCHFCGQPYYYILANLGPIRKPDWEV